jgi:hypothetical protein
MIALSPGALLLIGVDDSRATYLKYAAIQNVDLELTSSIVEMTKQARPAAVPVGYRWSGGRRDLRPPAMLD